MITFICVAMLSMIAFAASWYGIFRISAQQDKSVKLDVQRLIDIMQCRLDKLENERDIMRQRERALLVQLGDVNTRRAEEARERLDLMDERMHLELELQDLKNVMVKS